jgi:hypothetical protein
MSDGIQPGAGLDKEQVNYRQHERCAVCVHFYPLNSCDIIDGNISPENVCDHWEVKKKDMGKDAEFYSKEYEKSK